MALRRLTTPVMVTLTSSLVKPQSPERGAFESVPFLAVLLGKVEAVHNSLLSTQPNGDEKKRAKDIQQELAIVDLRHDDVLRGIWYLLTSMSFLTQDLDERELYLSIRDVLLPDGLNAVQKSYVEEAGNALLTQQRLNDSYRQALRSVKTPVGNAYEFVEEWFQLAAKLNELEQERAPKEENSTQSKQEHLKARNAWIKVIRSIQSISELLEVVPAPLRDFLERVSQAEERAEARSDRGTETNEDSPLEGDRDGSSNEPTNDG